MTTRRGTDEDGTGADKIAGSPGSIFSAATDDRISLRQVWQLLWHGKRSIIALTVVFALGAIAYALLAQEVYRAEVLLVPAKEQSTPMLGGQLGGLAALAGVNVGEGNAVEALAVLQSREFARAFIEQYDLLPLFFADAWDADEKRWQVDDPADAPDIRDGVKFFHEEVLRVSEDRGSGLVTLAIEWIDPDVAAEWASTLVRRLNDRLRDRALQEAQTNVNYLRSQMVSTNLVTLQESIGRLLENELQQLMLAKGNEEFAFKILDPAVSPKQRVRPKRALIVILGTILGGLLGAFGVLVVSVSRAGTDS